MGEELRNNLEDVQSSDMPLATIGVQTPLVIDLPDGQKLVINNLDPGTVIEVATWRGTGRPDSRTNRLMLGVSASKEELPASEHAHTKSFDKHGGLKPQLRPVTSEISTLGSESSLPYTASTSKNASEQIQQSSAFKEGSILRSIAKGCALALIVVSVFAGLVGPGKFRVVHPQSGVASSLGSAANSFVVLRQGSSAKVGEAVVANIANHKASPVLAVVNAVAKDNYLLATNTEQFQSNRKKIHGKVLFVIPYLGFFATLMK